MNVYQMYVENGNKAGFWVKRNSWTKKAAYILEVDGHFEGELTGEEPYFDNPVVLAKFYGSIDVFQLTCPGTFAYKLIPQPYYVCK